MTGVIVSAGFAAKYVVSGDLTGNQRATLGAQWGWGFGRRADKFRLREDSCASAQLIASIFAAAAVAIPVSVAIAGPTVTGSDGNTQSLEVTVSPSKLPKKTVGATTLKVNVKTGTTTAPNGVPSPAVHDVIDFDKNTTVETKGLPTCNATLLQSASTEVAEQKCGKAKIGTGSGTALLPLGQTQPEVTKVTAFNGAPQNGKPVVLLHAYGTSPLQTTLVLTGVVSEYDKEGFGPRLDVAVPPIAGGSGAITDFTVTINKKWTYKGQKMSFISAKCPASKKLEARGAFTYKDGMTLTALATQSCSQAPEPKK